MIYFIILSEERSSEDAQRRPLKGLLCAMAGARRTRQPNISEAYVELTCMQ